MKSNTKPRPKLKLKEFASIRSGYLFRKRINHNSAGNISVIQLRDVSEDGTILYNNLTKVQLHKYSPEDELKKGDLIFKAKSNRKVASVINREVHGLVASVHYFVLRAKNETIIPEFLSWYLNQKDAQQYFTTYSRGTRIPIVNKEVLGNLEVVVPDLATQSKIVKVYNLFLKEHHLIEELKIKRKLLIKSCLQDVLYR